MKKTILTIVVLSLFNILILKAQENVIVFTADIENLGTKINSEYSETDARISPDGKTFYFIRWKSPDNMGGESSYPDIYYSELDENGEWTAAKNIGEPFNDETYNMVVGIRSDGNAMIVKAEYDEEAKTRLYIIYKKNGKWQEREPMPFDGVEDKIVDRGYSVSADFKTLVFASSENESYDLFVSFYENKKWSKPLFLGDVINTDEEEEWPVLANDNKTIYFSSKGFDGYGSADIYMSKRLDETWENWSEPVNLGEKINTAEYDADFIVDTQGKYAYLSLKNPENSKFDIYRILLSEAARPDPVVLVKGNVLNQTTNKPLEVEVFYYDMKTKKQLGSAYSDASTGGYKIVLPFGKKYSLMASAEGYASVSESLDLTEANKSLDKNTQYQEITKDLKLVPIVKGNVVKMNNLFFETGKAIINSDSYLELENMVKFLNDNPEINIEIQGYTDSQGSSVSNSDLSQKRADAVADYLKNNKISSNRITSKGYGETKPIATNATPEGRQKNRRVEFKIN